MTLKKRAALMATVMSLFLLGGCATSAHYAMAPELQNELETIDMRVGIEQREINPTIVVSVAGGANFGLIGALIDAGINNSRTKDAENDIQALRDALIEFDVDTIVLERLSTLREAVPLLAQSQAVLHTGPLTDQYESVLKEATADAVLYLTADYVTSADFSEIVVGVNASMFPGKTGLDKYRQSGRAPQPRAPKLSLRDALYRNMFTVRVKLPELADAAGNVAAWAADEGALARDAISTAVARLAMMIAMDMQQVQGEVVGTKGTPSTYINNLPARLAYDDKNGTKFYRYNTGAMTSEVMLAK